MELTVRCIVGLTKLLAKRQAEQNVLCRMWGLHLGQLVQLPPSLSPLYWSGRWLSLGITLQPRLKTSPAHV